MRCPNINQLPIPSKKKVGWPWTEDSPLLENNSTKMSRWPRISIVTPNFNQGQFIEEAIRSVLLQGYPELEYIIIDGGSTDESLDIIRKYEKWISYWESEPDRGQSHALNKGISISNGNILAWLNADDSYSKGTFTPVAKAFIESPNSIVSGQVMNFYDSSREEHLIDQSAITLDNIIQFWNAMGKGSHTHSWHQPGLFFPSILTRQVGPLDENLDYAMDYDLLCRLLKYTKVVYLPRIFSCFRLHMNSKTTTRHHDFIDENVIVYKRYRHSLQNPSKADASLAQFLIRRASYEIRCTHFTSFFSFIRSSWSATRKGTMLAVLNEAFRLLLGGRYTGRI